MEILNPTIRVLLSQPKWLTAIVTVFTLTLLFSIHATAQENIQMVRLAKIQVAPLHWTSTTLL